ADIDPFHPGMEVWASEDPKGDPKQEKYKGNPPQWLMTSKGEILARDEKVPPVEVVYWDADGLRELVSRGRVMKYGGGAITQGIEGGRSFWADILGDWREEFVTSVKGELRIYTTTIPATDRHVCLLQDHIYRIDVAHLAMGYAQNPMLGYYLQQRSASLWMSSDATTIAYGQPVKAKATLVAPADQAATGQLTLRSEGPVAISPSELTLSAAAGKTAEASFEVTLKERPALLYGGKLANLTGSFSGVAGLSTMLSLKIEEEPLQGVPMAQAEDFSAQTGGEVQVRDDKFGAVGKAISHWDTAGHTLQWKINVPQVGKYWLVLRYCTPAGAQRETTVDALAPLKQGFGGTGGFGSETVSDWAHQAVRGADGNRVTFDLTAGEHVVKMVNLDGKGMNLDYVALVPIK
ncbi:MAG: hypothetical protein KKI08_13740, partial [Armatimonadetes bacterium]|nr:hypothetical protein [Armatimonadota bacterium]